MIGLATATFVSSLLGSLHCVAMCGPLVGLHGGARSLRLAIVHALGRLTTYVALGALAGVVGQAIDGTALPFGSAAGRGSPAVDVAGHAAAAQHVASIIAGTVIAGWGVHSIAVARGWIRSSTSGGGAMFQRGLVQLRTRRAVRRAWLIGVLTGLLPCGWLWAFVVSAAGTARPLAGAAVMAVFWLGTVPAMTGLLAIGGPLIARLRRRLPVISACVLIGLGLGTLAMRWRDAGAAGVVAPHCHEVAP